MKRKFLVTLSSVGVLATTALLGCSGGKKVTYEDNCEALGVEVEALEKQVLGTYDAKYRYAAGITKDSEIQKRYEAFAEAEYSLIYEEGIINPWLAQNGVTASVARTVARQAGKASYGLTADKFKNVVVTGASITKEQRAKIDDWYENNGKPQDRTPDAEGWVKLDNANANDKLVDGKYTYGDQTFTTKNVFKTTYTTEIGKEFLNYLCNSWTYNSFHYCNMVDGLVENDKYGNLIGALADKYKVVDNEDGTQTWTFHLRSDATWVKNSDGSFVANVVPDDFVASLEYVLDASNGSNTASIVYGFIKGAKEYYQATAKKAKDPSTVVPAFSTVGVAADATANTISYTLNGPTPYFMSTLTYSPFLPVNRAFLEAEGADFGKSVNDLLVNGAFRIIEHEANDHMKYEKNASYYDKDHVYVDTVERKFIPGTSTSADVRKYYEAGTIDSFSVNPKDTEGWAKYIKGEAGTGTQKNPAHPECNAVTSFGTATYIGYFNFNRSFWEYNDKENAKNNAEALATAKALLNKNFRLGFIYGLDVLKNLAAYQETPSDWLMRGYTNRELVSLNGKDYADFVDDVYNEKNGLSGENKVSLTGIMNKNPGDPVYNADKAKALFAQAKSELLTAGLTEKDFPIKIDVIGDQDIESLAFEQAMYDTINANSNGVLQISINIPETDEQNKDWGSISNNYDYSMWSGWGPDYADPNTFGHTMCIGGDMVEQFGFPLA